MRWNWQQEQWPEFTYDASALLALEEQFKIESAKLIGASSVIEDEVDTAFKIELMSGEALDSSKIEGEMLNRDSVISSLLWQLGLATDYSDHHVDAKEKGIAALMVDNYRDFELPLTHEMLFKWHSGIITDTWHSEDVGQYRTSDHPMQVVSGYEGRYKVHFEAPPSSKVACQMEKFVAWFNATAPNGSTPLPPLTRAGIAHLYFVSIHPFSDGNGRIARALSEKVLAQAVGRAALVALSHVIERNRKVYYHQLERNNKKLAIDDWLAYFVQVVIDSAHHSQQLVRFVVEKTRLFDRVRGKLNPRQEKVLRRMFQAGLEGFQGGLSAEKYIKMTGAIRRTASRDLQSLVTLGALIKTGKLKGTRYWLNLPVLGSQPTNTSDAK